MYILNFKALRDRKVTLFCVALSRVHFAGDFMKDGAVYEDMMDFKTLKKYMEDQLEDYNMEPGVIAMDLVLFRDAIEHGNENHKIFFVF